MLFTPYPYQQTAISHILHNPRVIQAGGAGNFLDMGLGKTVSTLTAANQLIYHDRLFNKVLVIAPKLVAEETWPNEVSKWDHLAHMKVSIVAGTAKQRIAALRKPADIYCIGRDNVAWLVAICQSAGRWPFPFVVGDELSSFKSPVSKRFGALNMILPEVQKFVGLTGTPAPNGLVDLWAQMYLIDRGARLGDNFHAFKKEFFTYDTSEYGVEHNFQIRTEANPIFGQNIHVARIFDLIGDICISMKARDYLTLPERNDIFIDVKLDDLTMNRYHKFKRESTLMIQGEQINAFSAPGLYNKLLQFANGAVYDTELQYHIEHERKLDVLEELIEEAQGDPFLIFYNFQSDIDRIKQRLARYRPRVLEKGDTARWNRGEIPVMLMHSSGGYGLNLQDGGFNIAWYGLPWNLEWYLQSVARLDRQGQKRRVNNYHLLCPGTLEYTVAQRLRSKNMTQEELMFALKADIYELGTERKWRAIA